MVQRQAAGWVLGDYSPDSRVSDMLGRLGWHTLEQRRANSRLVLFYKIVHGYVAVPLPSYVIPLTCISRTSHPLAYRQICAGTDYYKYSSFPLTVVLWNSLPAPIATLTDLDSFKQAVSQVCQIKPLTDNCCFYSHFPYTPPQTPQTLFVVGYTVFTFSIFPSICPSVTLWFFPNILKTQWWIFINFCRHIDINKVYLHKKK